MFLMVDGVDGSGKGTIVSMLQDALERRGKRIVNLVPIMQKGRFPETKDWTDADVILTTEPMYAGAGAALRGPLLQDPVYDARTVAMAFAVDREIHYRRIVIPARAEGRIVISERGLVSSLVYQIAAGLDEREILALPGNALALAHAPDILVLTRLDVDTALLRLQARVDKQDNSYFEKRPMLIELIERYADPSLEKIFSDAGTRTILIDTSGSMETLRTTCVERILPLLLADS